MKEKVLLLIQEKVLILSLLFPRVNIILKSFFLLLCIVVLFSCSSTEQKKEVIPASEKTPKKAEISAPPTEKDDRLPSDSIRKLPVYGKNENIDFYIKTYQGRRRKSLRIYLKRSRVYINTIKSVFKKMGLPWELSYLPIVESGFLLVAKSNAEALGLWQFISSTGKEYKLKQTWWYDERMDPYKSTVAAATYLKRLYQLFGRWEYALAAYNAGPGRVGRAIKKLRKQGKKKFSFWDLRLPEETKEYVPHFLAIAKIVNNPTKYGFPKIRPVREERVGILKVPGGYRFQEISDLTGVSVQTLNRLNPVLMRRRVPHSIERFNLRMPISVLDQLEWIDFNQVKKYYTVQKKDNLWKIAKKLGTSPRKLLSENKIKSSEIKAGKRLFHIVELKKKRIKKTDKDEEKEEKEVIKKEVLRQKKSKKKKREKFIVHTVKKGESIWKITSIYGVSSIQISRLNPGVNLGKMKPGTRLKLPKEGARDE